MKNSKSEASSGKPVALSTQEALAKILRYCAYQERSHQEVKNKLYSFGLRTDDVNETLSHLITEGFLNEERFAKAFAGGKFRIMKWGRIKIQRELEAQGLTPRCIAKGLKEIDQADYQKALTSLLKKKLTQSADENSYTKKNKAARFVISKGYEPEMVWETLNSLLA
jgi:regulatory protein